MGCSRCGSHSSSSRVGTTYNTAIIFGDDNRERWRARITGSVAGLQVGAIKYIGGSGVQDLVDLGLVSLIANSYRVLPAPNSSYKLWYVGDTGFTTLDAARVHSAHTGLEIVERSF